MNANGELRTVNIILNGVGRVNITVKTQQGTLVAGARVSLASRARRASTRRPRADPR